MTIIIKGFVLKSHAHILIFALVTLILDLVSKLVNDYQQLQVDPVMELSQFQDLVKRAETPIRPHVLENLIRFYPNQSDANLLVDGFTKGFKLNYHGPRVATDCQNLRSVLVFLGLEINTVDMTVRITSDKLCRLKDMLNELIMKNKTTLKDLQLLVGLLNFCTRAIPPARAFNRRFYDAMSGLSKPFHRIRINKEMKEDINIWLMFLDLYNGISCYDSLSGFQIMIYIYLLIVRKRQIIGASLADESSRTYKNALKMFDHFRSHYGIIIQWPPNISYLYNFIAFLSLKGCASSTIRTYISAICNRCKMLNFTDTTKSFIVKKNPFFCWHFFGFFRIGELVVSSINRHGHALQSNNIHFLEQINSLEIFIPHSKTDQSGRGSVLLIPATYLPICAVKAVKSFMNIRPPYFGTFFCHLSGQPVSRYQFNCVLRKCLNFAQIDSKLYKSHSFRTGAATTCSILGVDENKMAELGRWKSNSYKSYIRVPSSELVQVSDLPNSIWIIGSSIISRAFVRAKQSSFRKNLQLDGFNASVLWQGKPGMKWGDLIIQIKHLLTMIDPPKFLVLHCSGNDISSYEKSIELMHRICFTIKVLWHMLPNTKLIWSQILPRLKWRNERNHKAVNKSRVRINSYIAKFIISNGGLYIRYPEIIQSNVGMFDNNKVHLSQLGNDIFLYRLQQALQVFITSDSKMSPLNGESGPWLYF
ncbi:hypothetical protein KUTeg_010447 [Tegillarca granosa]|uniref:Tyr recombinase domain-containing protein n=1 Tax=Tegillarca granosa TaxID=220873 RepID=A0ABQ9F6R6_TEGGR|nr:hypothetical protein KUTeg_010447 [Tegillarca granosa]